MKLEYFDYFLGLRNDMSANNLSYALIDLSWMSPPESASTIKEAYSLLTGAILEKKTVLFSKVPEILLKKNLSSKEIEEIIEGIESSDEAILEKQQRSILRRNIKLYMAQINHSPIPEEIIFRMKSMYNKDIIRNHTINPFLYQP